MVILVYNMYNKARISFFKRTRNIFAPTFVSTNVCGNPVPGSSFAAFATVSESLTTPVSTVTADSGLGGMGWRGVVQGGWYKEALGGTSGYIII